MSEERARFKTPWADESTVTLRGLRVAWAPERVVPWAELVAHRHNGNMLVWSVDREGEPLRVGGRRVSWSVGLAHQRTVAAMIRRGQRRALESGQYFVTVNRSRWAWLFGGAMIALGAALLVVLGAHKAWPRTVWLWGVWSTLSPIDRAIELGLLAIPVVFITALAGFPIVLGWSFLRVRARRVTLTGDGLVVTGPSGEVQTILWEEVTSIRGLEVCRIRTIAGDTVLVPNELHAKHVMWHHRRRLRGEPKPVSGRRLLVRLLVIHQIGGVIAAAMAPLTGLPAWRAYVAIGWGFPLMFAVPGGLLWLMTRISRARSEAKRRQRRRGVSGSGPRPAQTRHPAAVSPPPR